MDVYRKKRAIYSYLVYKHFVLKKKRRYSVHPFTDLRLARGRFITSFADLREHSEKFFNYFRMSIQLFDELAARITDKIKLQDTCMRLAIPPMEMLAITLRYSGSGCDQIDLHLTYRVGHSTIGKILRRVPMQCNFRYSKRRIFPEFT